jgi:Protein of unknown function (DUF4232)
MSRLRSRTAPALAAVVAVLIAGCGSSGLGKSSSTHAASATKTVTHTVTSDHQTKSGAETTASGTTTSTSQSPTPSVRTTSAGLSICRAAGVKITYLGGQGATGHGLLGFAMQNTSSAPCTTLGYPGIQFESKRGTALPTRDIRTTTDFFGTTKLARLTVAPGQSASFRLGVSHGAATTQACVTAGYVQVIPPNDTSTVRIAIPGGVYECGGAVTVSPMQPGDSAYH